MQGVLKIANFSGTKFILVNRFIYGQGHIISHNFPIFFLMLWMFVLFSLKMFYFIYFLCIRIALCAFNEMH
jgi:hypothetical protein